LCLQHDALRDLKSSVPQNGSDQMVGEHFWSEWAHRNGGLPLRLSQAGIDLRRSLVGAVVQRRQIGVDEFECGGTDGHDGLL
jgi:hypothetical protein